MLTLRRAQQEDCRLLWEWANDPTVRESAFSSEPIAWEMHKQWFKERLKDPNCHLFIALERTDTPVAQVRFDTAGQEATVDISVSLKHRGQGYGTEILKLASRELFRLSKVKRISAYIKPSNEASMRAFSKAGFILLSETRIKGHQARHMVLERQDPSQEADPSETHFIVAASKSWNRRIFDEEIQKYPGIWHFTARPDDLSSEWIRSINPRYIFFLHWSWKVPAVLKPCVESCSV